jgi:formylglycine-generating enzyme required for sulfatase activity/DNA-binding winged helix-turn-helix (wHTH) protein
MSYRIDAYVIDPAGYEVRHKDVLVPVEPQVLELLVFLIENRQRTVTKDEIIERVWKGRIVSDATLSSRIKAARQVLGDDGTAQRFIRTVHGRGFRFVGEVVEVDRSAPSNPKVGADRLAATRSNGAETRPRAAGLAARLAGSPPGARFAAAAAVCVALVGAAYLVNHLAAWGVGSGSDNAPGGLVSRPASTAPKAPATFRDCDACPEMIELFAGEFMMGSPDNEQARQRAEGPRRQVAIAKRFALGKFEVTIDQFETFVAETGLTVGNGCYAIDVRTSKGIATEASFRHPGFDITKLHPVVCVSWHEAQAYAAWLGRRTGKPYRLPSEAEWEFAARAATATSYSFGDDDSELCQYARFADLDSRFNWRGGCRSGVTADGPMAVGKLKPNPWGLFDMHGNAWEWVSDCWTADAHETPADGSAFTRLGGCEVGVVRGGSWAAAYHRVRSAVRMPMPVAKRLHHTGFRVALSLGSQ